MSRTHHHREGCGLSNSDPIAHIQCDVLWTASTLDPVVDMSEEAEEEGMLTEGSGVNDVDTVDSESESDGLMPLQRS